MMNQGKARSHRESDIRIPRECVCVCVCAEWRQEAFQEEGTASPKACRTAAIYCGGNKRRLVGRGPMELHCEDPPAA